jgi:glycosyltransferase involved in cell wall biosynthesis
VKVVILHQHFKTPHSGGAIRSYYLATALVAHGIDTIVITGHNNPTQKIEWVDGIRVHYLPVPYDNAYSFWKRSRAFLAFAFKSVRCMWHHRDADLCYAISVPLTVGWAALRIKKKYGIPFLFEVGDLWPEAPIQMGFVKNYFFKRALYRLEKKIYQHSEAIVALSPTIKSEIEKKGVGGRVYLIPNMADTKVYQPDAKHPDLEKKFGVEGKLVVSYIGALGVANGLEYLLKCAKECQANSLPIHFLLCGQGAMRTALQRMARQENLANVTWHDFTNREGVLQILNVTDAVFISYAMVPVLETGSPNKFFDGLAAGKLILINFGGWIKEKIEEYTCGVFVDPSNSKDFTLKLQPFIRNPERLKQYGDSARKLAEDQYSRLGISATFVEALVSHLKHPPAKPQK